VETFGDAFPELVKNQDTIMEIVKEEEEAFSSMLERGIKFFNELESDLKEKGEKKVGGDKAFFLYDTLGFPIDLTELMAEEAGLVLDVDGFSEEMEAQKQRSRDARNAAKSGNAPKLELIAEQTAWLADNGVLATDDSFKYGLDAEVPATVKALFGPDGFLTGGAKAESGDFVGIVLDKSSYYAEAGGQEADVGKISCLSDDGEIVGSFSVTDVQAYGGFILHKGAVEEGSVEVGAPVKCQVNYERRRLVAPNHSMTHVLNAALRKVLGDGVEQRGSLCNDVKLRFDFSHKKALSAKQLRATEELCQQSIADKEEVTSEVMPLQDAQAIDGVQCVFGEVYPDPVRVVKVGSDTSIEFCGGTHVANTNEAEAFVIVEETAVAKGIRRISAVTKEVAANAIAEGSKFDAIVAEAEQLSADTPDLDKKAGGLRKELDQGFFSAVLKSELRARIEAIQKKAIEAKKAALASRVDRCLNDVKAQLAIALAENKQAIVLNVDIGADSKASQKVMNAAKKVAPGIAFMGLSKEEQGSGGKLVAFSVVPDALVEEGFKADEWVRTTLEACGGRGGGNSGSAQGQAKECDDIDAIMSVAKEFAKTKVGAAVL